MTKSITFIKRKGNAYDDVADFVNVAATKTKYLETKTYPLQITTNPL